jgi:hypothetical protein
MKRFYILILGLLVLMPAQAIEIDYSNDSKVAAGLKLGMSTRPTLDVEIEASFRPFRYVGVNASVLMITPFNSRKNFIDSIPLNNDIYSEMENYKEGGYKVVAKAGLQFTTPAVMLSKNEMGLSLRVSPGISIPIPTNKSMLIYNYKIYKLADFWDEDESLEENEHFYIYDSKVDVKNSGAKFCYWYVRSELVLEFEEQWEFLIGYTYSNLDLYGGSRSIKVNDTPLVIGDKKPHHTISLGLTYKF